MSDMALREHAGATFDSIDFILDIAMRIVKAVIEMGPDKNHRTADAMPDLLKDIHESKMTRCEDQLGDQQNSDGVNSSDATDNSQQNDSTASHMSPVPFTVDDTRTVRFTAAHLSAQNSYTTTTTGSRDLESLEIVASNPNNYPGRRVTYPEIFENRRDIREPELPALDHRGLNVSIKKPYNNLDLQSEILTNHHDGEEMPPLTSEIVFALRNIGDNLDKNIDPKAKKSMMQSCISYTISDLKNSFPLQSFRVAFDLSVKVMVEYNRL